MGLLDMLMLKANLPKPPQMPGMLPQGFAAGLAPGVQAPGAPAAPKQSYGLWDKLQEGIAPWPKGLEGLITDKDVQNARNQGLLGFGASLLANSGPRTAAERVGLGQALGQGLQAGMQGYQGGIDQAVKNRMAAMQAKRGQQEIQSADAQQKLLEARQAVFSKMPPPQDDMDHAAVSHWIDQVAPALVAAGDTEGAGKLVELRRALATAGDKYQAVQAGDAIYTFDPKTGQYTRGPERGMPADQLEMKRLSLAEQRARTQATQEAAQAGRVDRLVSNYDKQSKDLFDRAIPINQAEMALDHARTDPTVGGNAIVAFLTAVDPKAQQRYQMVNWLSTHLSPSLAMTAQRFLEGKTTGLLPKELIDAMQAHLQRTKQITIKQATQARTEYEKLHPEVAGQLRDINSEFTNEAAGYSGGAPAAPTVVPRQPGESISDYMKRTQQ